MCIISVFHNENELLLYIVRAFDNFSGLDYFAIEHDEVIETCLKPHINMKCTRYHVQNRLSNMISLPLNGSIYWSISFYRKFRGNFIPLAAGNTDINESFETIREHKMIKIQHSIQFM